MAINTYFNNFSSAAEQSLIEDLVIESIKMYGVDVYYLPRTIVSRDAIFTEDDVSKYEDAVKLEMYVKSVDGFQGEGDFLSKFGLEIRDEITFSVAQSRFSNTVIDTGYSTNTRPVEGDLIFFPFNQKLFQIKFVEHEAVFYQMGKLQTYDLVCELFEYSDEEINTGNTTIDAIESDYSQKQSIYITSTSGTFTVGEIVSQTLTLDDTLYGTAVGTATVANGAITEITLTSSGYGYSSAPAITVTGGGGSNADLTAVLTSGRVTGVTVNDGGSGFSSTPTITFAPPATQTIRGELLTITANTEANNAYTLQMFNVKTDNINYNNFINGIVVTGLTSNATGNVSSTTAETLPTVTQNDSFETVADNFLDFSEADPFSEGGSY